MKAESQNGLLGIWGWFTSSLLVASSQATDEYFQFLGTRAPQNMMGLMADKILFIYLFNLEGTRSFQESPGDLQGQYEPGRQSQSVSLFQVD